MQRVLLRAVDPLNSAMVVVSPLDVPDSRSALVSLEDLCDDPEDGVMVYIPGASWEQNYAMFYDQVTKGNT
jgi:hypothetical protein